MRNKLTEVTEGTPNQLPKNLYRKQLLKKSLFREFPTALTVTTSLLMSVQNWKELNCSFEEHVINKKEILHLKMTGHISHRC